MHPAAFEKGKAPGDTDGGETYEFIFEDRSFSYIKNGEESCRLLVGGQWYAVSNPSDPPEQSFFSDPTLDESITIINSNGKLLFSIISATPDVEYVTADDPDNPVKLRAYNSAGDAFFTELFRLMNGKDAMNDVYKYSVDYRIRASYPGVSYHYEFALCSESGSVAVTNNGELIGSIMLSGEEVTKLLALLDEYRADESAEVPFAVQYIRTDGYHDGAEYPIITVINTKAALDGYFNRYRSLYDFSHKDKVYSDTTIGFVDAIQEYDDIYYQSHILVLVLLEEGSGSVRHEVRRVYSDGDIELSKILPEGDGTDDMAEWHIILEINKADTARAYRLCTVTE